LVVSKRFAGFDIGERTMRGHIAVCRNVRIEDHWGAGDIERTRRCAEELVALAAEVILSSGGPSVVALQQATRAAPIAFVIVVDPVGAGFVEV
jgi:putative tryptophan/tyrosine transport system substrate-binding protein